MAKQKKKQKTVTHQQWIEITRVNGVTVSTFYPPNHEFEKIRLKLDPQPELIYRRLNFVHGVPPEYWWTKPTKDVEQYGGHFLQRVSLADWQKVLELESMPGNKHVRSSHKFVPRPEDMGPCPCPNCTRERGEIVP